VNATIGLFLKIVTLPLTLLGLGTASAKRQIQRSARLIEQLVAPHLTHIDRSNR